MENKGQKEEPIFQVPEGVVEWWEPPTSVVEGYDAYKKTDGSLDKTRLDLDCFTLHKVSHKPRWHHGFTLFAPAYGPCIIVAIVDRLVDPQEARDYYSARLSSSSTWLGIQGTSTSVVT